MYAVYRRWKKRLDKILDGIPSLEEAHSIAIARQTETADPDVRYLVHGPIVPGRRGGVWLEPNVAAKRHIPDNVDAPTEQQNALQHSGGPYVAQQLVENETAPHPAISGHTSDGAQPPDASRPSSYATTQLPVSNGENGYTEMRRLHDDISIIKTGIASLQEARLTAALKQQQESEKKATYYVQAPRRSEAATYTGADTAETSNTICKPGSSTSADARHTSSEPRTSERSDAVSRSRSGVSSQKPQAPTRYLVVRVVNGSRSPVKGGFRSLDDACEYALALQNQCTNANLTYEVEYSLPTERQVEEQRLPDPAREPVATPRATSRPPLPKKGTPKREQLQAKQGSGVQCYVVRVQGQSRVTVRGGFDSPEQARAYANTLAEQTGDPSVSYEIAYSGSLTHSSSRGKAKKTKIEASAAITQPYGRASRPVPKRHTERRKHDWEVEDRDGDVSLVVRDEDELGIGIPAQWGKGRRNRRGTFIP